MTEQMERLSRWLGTMLKKLGVPEAYGAKLLQFLGFCLVGVSNTLLSYVVYLAAISLGCHYLAASVLGFGISVINAFYWNNKYIFQPGAGEKRSILATFCKTVLSYAGTGLVLANLLLILWVEVLSLPQWLGPLLNLLVTIPLNFLLNKLWAFRGKS